MQGRRLPQPRLGKRSVQAPPPLLTSPTPPRPRDAHRTATSHCPLRARLATLHPNYSSALHAVQVGPLASSATAPTRSCVFFTRQPRRITTLSAPQGSRALETAGALAALAQFHSW